MVKTLPSTGLLDTPGSWLSAYRSRPSGPYGPLTAEGLGAQIGVSGVTVRRWETGAASPSSSDLRRIAEVCDLNEGESLFLSAAFLAVDRESPPDPDAFRDYARYLLSCEVPAMLMDSFYYPRAWNAYWQEVTRPAMRPFETAFTRFPGAPELMTSAYTQRNVISEFWRSSAYLCGSEPYRAFLAEMRKLDGFQETWQRIALEAGYILDARLPGAPFDIGTESVGHYRVHPVPVVIPPTYHMRVMIPMDATAIRLQLELQSDSARRTVFFAAASHWSSGVSSFAAS
jgi:transcriptional regulator with XRE-family HTH domain